MRYNGLVASITEQVIRRPPITFRYPRVAGLPASAVERRINAAIQQLVLSMIRQQNVPGLQYLTGTYMLPVNRRGVLSVVFDTDSYSGGAHGMQYKRSLTFSLRTGRIYQLADLFLPGSDWKRRIDAYIRRQIEAQNIPLIAPFRGIGSDQPFYLTQHALVIYFQLYEYTPYAYGFPLFAMPYTLFRDIVNPGGPIARLMRA
ncbi:DUF3298 and DUF4163 domain-containing protein [Brevibacillus humidisoli]|uniref:DUF3298 and DUF4163 domain-containing protein n=1 Tax=Brevibacillus humidisoli TaxID=2895522 RepID=UPI001E51C577|nr:DUF3298 and DUF4163 domain-containing protein [Brevibacillus humidisoli]UFJ39153.1 DUF3298 and DUF4163 domain-containing protein [Brevibacillus humidisoli]